MAITPERREAIQELAKVIAEPGKEAAATRPLLNTLVQEFGSLAKEEKEMLLMECCDLAEKGFSGPHRERIAQFRDAMRRLLAVEPEQPAPPSPPEPAPFVPPVGPPVPPPAPHSNPLPRGEGTRPEPAPAPEPTPETTPEAPSFSRHLRDILADPASPEAINLLEKLKGPSGRLWIDKKSADGKKIRIWLSLDLTPADKSKPNAEFIEIIKKKLTPGNLRFRVDNLSTGNSWKEKKWTEAKKGEIRENVATLQTHLRASPPQDIVGTASAIAGQLGLAGEGKDAFIAHLKEFCAKDGAADDPWTSVRNAYWHADGWQNEEDTKRELGTLGLPPDTFKPPSYASAKIRVWQKIGEELRGGEIEGKTAPLFSNGTKFPAAIVEKKAIAEGRHKGTWYHIGTHWVREDHLRISLRQNPPLPAGEDLGKGTFELLAWQVQPEEPKEGTPATPAVPAPKPNTPPPAQPKSKGPTTPTGSPAGEPKKGPQPTTPLPAAPSQPAEPQPKGPPVTPPPTIVGKKEGRPDATPTNTPKTAPPAAGKGPDVKGPTAPKIVQPKPAPKESHESAEVLREREVIAIPDIHGEANALLTSLKVTGYIEPKDAKWDEGWHLTEAGQKAHIVFTGDLLDRGSENIGVLEIVKKLRAEGARIEILAGNHEMILLNTLQSSHQSDWLHWIGNGGGSVLKELGENAHISTNAVTILDVLSYLPHMEKHKKNFAGMPLETASCAELLHWWKRNSSKITQTINDTTDQSIRSTLEHTSITDADIAAFGKLQGRAKETFLVQYGEMVKSLNLMTIVDDVLYVHASLNEYWIDMLEREGIDGVNREFHTAIKDPKKLREMAGSTGKYGDVMWSRNLQKNLKEKPELVKRLKQLGIRMIVHGHTETSGAQMHNTVDDLHIVNGDVSMYRRPGGAFVRVRGRRHKENGKVEGFVGTSRNPYDETGHKTLASLA